MAAGNEQTLQNGPDIVCTKRTYTINFTTQLKLMFAYAFLQLLNCYCNVHLILLSTGFTFGGFVVIVRSFPNLTFADGQLPESSPLFHLPVNPIIYPSRPNPITHGTKHYQLGGNETVCLSATSLSLSGRINQSGSSPSGFLPTLKDASPRSDIFIVSQQSIAEWWMPVA